MEELFLTLKTTNMKCELIFYYTCTAVLLYKFSGYENNLTNTHLYKCQVQHLLHGSHIMKLQALDKVGINFINILLILPAKHYFF